jgi:uncharacterized protein (DUF2249 family)
VAFQVWRKVYQCRNPGDLTGVKAPSRHRAYVEFMVNQQTITLDVREDLRRGREPFSRILETVARLAAGEDLLLIAPFEPVPLLGALQRAGFGYESRQSPAGDWEVRFSRTLPLRPDSRGASGAAACAGPSSLDMDARGLEPPQPMVRILEALDAVPAGGVLRARTDRRPMHLFAQLEARGFSGESIEQSDGSFITHIRRSGS